jgi:hypothetical protein
VEFVGHIGGATNAVTLQVNYAYIGEGPTLAITDSPNPVVPAVVSKTQPLPGVLFSLTVTGTLACAAVPDGGLRVVDISDPSSPSAANWGGLRIANIEIPAAPYEAGFYDAPGGMAWSIAAAGEYAYVSDGLGGLLVLRLT